MPTLSVVDFSSGARPKKKIGTRELLGDLVRIKKKKRRAPLPNVQRTARNQIAPPPGRLFLRPGRASRPPGLRLPAQRPPLSPKRHMYPEGPKRCQETFTKIRPNIWRHPKIFNEADPKPQFQIVRPKTHVPRGYPEGPLSKRSSAYRPRPYGGARVPFPIATQNYGW